MFMAYPLFHVGSVVDKCFVHDGSATTHLAYGMVPGSFLSDGAIFWNIEFFKEP